jgi:hypothetical protein
MADIATATVCAVLKRETRKYGIVSCRYGLKNSQGGKKELKRVKRSITACAKSSMLVERAL